MELARNPAMMQELMRTQDRAMSNLEVSSLLLKLLGPLVIYPIVEINFHFRINFKVLNAVL